MADQNTIQFLIPKIENSSQKIARVTWFREVTRDVMCLHSLAGFSGDDLYPRRSPFDFRCDLSVRQCSVDKAQRDWYSISWVSWFSRAQHHLFRPAWIELALHFPLAAERFSLLVVACRLHRHFSDSSRGSLCPSLEVERVEVRTMWKRQAQVASRQDSYQIDPAKIQCQISEQIFPTTPWAKNKL